MSYLVSACDTVEEVVMAVGQDPDVWCEDIQVVKTAWLSTCIQKGCIQTVHPNHIIPHALQVEKTHCKMNNFKLY